LLCDLSLCVTNYFLDKWPKTAAGLPSTSGTTASIIFVRRGKIYIGHVGDSSIVMGGQQAGTEFWKARPLTLEHKPENAYEIARINQYGFLALKTFRFFTKYSVYKLVLFFQTIILV